MRLRIVISVVLFLFAVLGMTTAPKADDALWIVFGSFRGGDFSGSIYAIQPDGSSERELSVHPDGHPASLDPWSTLDGSLILFTRGGGGHRSSVWALDPAQGEERAETSEVMTRFNNGRAWPSLRPGHPAEFCYVRESGGERRIALEQMGSSEFTDLGPGEFPSWSPGGERLAYVREETVWIQTVGEDDGRPVGGSLEQMSYPSWSPDGDHLLVTAELDSGWDIFEIGLDGTTLRRLTFSPEFQERAATWSPNGELVAYSGRAAQPANGWENSIYVLNVSTGESSELTSGSFHDSRPTWTRRQAP